MDFIQNNLDYLYFLYGLAILLSSLIIWRYMHIPNARLAWGWLAGCGVMLGVSVWLDALALGMGDTPLFQILRTLLKSAAYILLFASGRRSLSIINGKQAIPTWFIYPLVGLFGLGGLAGEHGWEAASRLTLAFPSGIFIAVVFWKIAQTSQPAEQISLRCLCFIAVVSAITSLYYAPGANLFPANLLNQQILSSELVFFLLSLRLIPMLAVPILVWLAINNQLVKTEPTNHYHHWFLGGVLLVIISGSYWITNSSGKATDEHLRSTLLTQVSLIARQINPNHIKSLAFNQDDIKSPKFQRLSNQMKAYADAIGFRSLYSMAIRDGNIIFGPESLLEDDPYASPPGTVYLQPTAKIWEIFETGEPFSVGPYTDEYGTFVSAMAPVKDLQTGEVLLVIGVDLPADRWQAEIAQNRMLPLLLVMLFCVLLFPSSIYLVKHKRTTPHQSVWMLQSEVLITALAGILITLALAALTHQ